MNRGRLVLLVFCFIGILAVGVFMGLNYGGGRAPEALPINAVTWATPSSLADTASAPTEVESQPATITALSDQIAGLRAELYALKESLRNGSFKVARNNEEVDISNAVTDPLPGSDAGPIVAFDRRMQQAEMHKEADIQREAFIQKYTSAFLAQETDVEWANKISSVITAALNSEELAVTTLNSLECRSSLCRLSVTHDSDDSQDRFWMSFSHKIAPSITSTVSDKISDSGREKVTTLFLEGDAQNAAL